MASEEYPYPSDLDSDGGYDSDQYSDDSDVSGTGSLTTNMSFMSFRSSPHVAGRPRSRPSGSSSSAIPTPTYLCIVSLIWVLAALRLLTLASRCAARGLRTLT